MKNTDTQRKLLSATISPSKALNQALIDEKGYFNHQKLTNMSRSSTNGTTFKSFSNHNHIKKKPSLNIERSNSCMKCGNTFTKGHLNVCPAKEITCKNCNYKGHFAKLCKSRNKRPTVNTVSNYVNTENCTYTPPENSWMEEKESCEVINAWHERNILGNDNLPKLGREITHRKCPQPICKVNQPTLESEYKNLPSLSDKIFNEFKNLFTRVGKIPNDRKVTHFHTPFKPIQSKGRRVPLHLLAGVNEELKRMEKGGHIIKLEKCDEDCFISPIEITRKKNTSIKLALDSKLLNDQTFKNKYQMPNIHELIDNVALQISEKSNRRVWFSNLDLKNAYSQLKLCDKISKQCNFSILGVETTGTFRFLTGFYGLETCPMNSNGSWTHC